MVAGREHEIGPAFAATDFVCPYYRPHSNEISVIVPRYFNCTSHTFDHRCSANPQIHARTHETRISAWFDSSPRYSAIRIIPAIVGDRSVWILRLWIATPGICASVRSEITLPTPSQSTCGMCSMSMQGKGVSITAKLHVSLIGEDPKVFPCTPYRTKADVEIFPASNLLTIRHSCSKKCHALVPT
ncbi:hypothetical protein OBBRIDRAFT_474232 [Obba rivulosa]|uniref:Uncharacterized protein n=1 Tax=Obba rivulosa TaxID=1052685 RepID=A0A8E2AL73_9APHY|nr:hypothetical protein OBBRIDRAFT_474232 [Obba rivulosa]